MDNPSGTGIKKKKLVERIARQLQFYHNHPEYDVYFEDRLVDKDKESFHFAVNSSNDRDYAVWLYCDSNFSTSKIYLWDSIENIDIPKTQIVPYFEQLIRVVPKLNTIDWIYGKK